MTERTRTIPFIAFLLLLLCGNESVRAQDYPIQPIPFTEVQISEPFWSHRLDVNRTVTILHAIAMCEKTGRVKNFELARDVLEGVRTSGQFCTTYGFDDSDLYKIIEGASYTLHTKYDAALDHQVDSLIAIIASAQEPDGYLYTMRSMKPSRTWAPQRWVNARTKGSHELYNLGHLYEAAVAHYEATGKRSLLDVALKSADLLCRTFGPDKIHTAPGHQVIELGLVKLYRLTKQRKYLELARFFLDERGRGPDHDGEYNQDHIPVVDQTEAVGHAVRAGYMYAGMADVAALMDDKAYVNAIDRIWENVVGKKYYVMGGVGAEGDWEGYGPDYALPNLTAYNETCASIALVYWNHRMFLLHGDAAYIDVLERTLYNGILPGVSLDGKSFFYPNPLESRGDYQRSDWFECACCPGNITRFIASVGGYIYARRGDSLYVNLFAGSTTTVPAGKGTLSITQSTDYPWGGRVELSVKAKQPAPLALCIRIPGWARNQPVPSDLYSFERSSAEQTTISINGVKTPFAVNHGYAIFDRQWSDGDKVEIKFPMTVRRVVANEKVKDDRNKVCLERGPLMYCAEGIDNDGEVNDIIIPPSSTFKTDFHPDLLNGVEVITGNVEKVVATRGGSYFEKRPDRLVAIPYYAWAHRGAGTMTIWFHTDKTVFPPVLQPGSTIFLDSISVAIPQYAGQEIHVTTDGTLPTKASPPYVGPMTFKEGNVVLKAKAFGPDGEGSDVVSGEYAKTTLIAAKSEGATAPGILTQYYEGKVDSLPDFASLTPKKSAVLDTFDIMSLRDVSDNYLMQFSGSIRIPASGVYSFWLTSDDGSKLFIGDTLLIRNDFRHGPTEVRGQLALQAGMHPFRLEYFEYRSAEYLQLEIEGPGIKRQSVPASMLFHKP